MRTLNSHIEWTEMHVVSPKGVNFGFWSRLGCSGQNVIIFSRQGPVKGCTRRNNKTERILILYIYSIHINKVFHNINILSPLLQNALFICLFYKLVSFKGLHKLRPRPDWSLLGVKFKISDEHPRPLHMEVPPPPGPAVWLQIKYNAVKVNKTEILYIKLQEYSQEFFQCKVGRKIRILSILIEKRVYNHSLV